MYTVIHNMQRNVEVEVVGVGINAGIRILDLRRRLNYRVHQLSVYLFISFDLVEC